MTSKIRRTVIAATLAASALTVGGVGIGNAWAQSATPSASASSSSSTDTSGSTASTTDNCPQHDANDASASSSASG